MTLNRRNVLILLLVVFVILFARYDRRALKRSAADFRVTYAAAQAFAEKRELYSKFEDPSIAVYKYSPFFAMMAAPLAGLTLHGAALVFFALNFGFLALIFFYSAKIIAGEEAGAHRLLLYLLPLLFTARYFLAILDAGQVNIVMLGFCVFGVYAARKEKEALAAAFFVTAVMIKYTPLIFIPYFFFRKKRKLALWSVVFGAVCCFLPMVYVGVEKGLAYLAGWMPYVAKTSLDIGSLADFRNQSLLAAILRYFSEGQYFVDRIRWTHLTIGQGFLLSAGVSGLLYLLMLVPGKGNREPRFQAALDISLLFLGVALFNANAWAFNYASMFFGYMTLTYYLARTGFRDKMVLSAMGLAFLLSMGGRGIVGKNFREWADIYSFATLGALILMLGLLKLKFMSSNDPMDKPQSPLIK